MTMRPYEQKPEDVVGTAAVPKASPFAIRGNTRTVVVWHLEKTPAEREAEAQRQTALNAEKGARERAEMEQRRARYRVSSTEWTASEKKWREFLASRSREGAAQDFVSSWHDYMPSQPRKVGILGEAQFSRLVPAQHDQCVLCKAASTISGDSSLGEHDKERLVRRLAHRDPKRLISPPTGETGRPGPQGESTFEDLISTSAWGHVQASSAQKGTVTENESLFRNMVDKADLMESKLAAKSRPHKLSLATTKFLVKGAGLLDDHEIVDYLTNNKVLRHHSEAVLQRVAVYRANKGAAQSALVAANSDNRLSVDDIEKTSKVKADALELERDLVMLETRQKANKACLELAKKGHSKLKHNDVFCEFRRSQKAAGYYHHQRGGYEHCEGRGRWYTDDDNDDEIEEEAEQELGSSFANKSTFERLEKVKGVSPASRGPTPPLAQTHSPEAQTEEASKYIKTMQEFSKHTREQEDDASVSTEDGPFNLEQALGAASGTAGAAGPSTEVETAPSPKSKEKKDSKVGVMLKEDRVSLKDFATEPGQKKDEGLQKLSVNASSPSRPRWK